MPTQTKFFVISLILLTFCVSACGRGSAQSDPSASAGAQGGNGRGRSGRGAGGPVPVTTAKVASRAVPVVIPAVGTVEAVSTVQIRAQVTGQLSEVHFAEGQDVQKGQLLFTIDPRPFQAALQQAQAVLARDTATATNATAQTARYEDLYKRGLIPRDQYETQQASTQSAQATLEADRAAVETAQLNLAYTQITAPIAGRTGALGAHVGDLIRANDTTPLVVINQLSPIYVTFSVPGRYLGDIRRYQAQRPLEVIARGQASLPPGAQPPAPITHSRRPGDRAAGAAAPGAEAGPSAIGTVTFIDNAVDPATGTIKLKGTFPNSDHRLWPGLFVQVSAESDDRPQRARRARHRRADVAERPVRLRRQGRSHRRHARRSRSSASRATRWSSRRGCRAGEEVVTDGQLRLTPGAKVARVTGSRGRETGANGGNHAHELRRTFHPAAGCDDAARRCRS